MSESDGTPIDQVTALLNGREAPTPTIEPIPDATDQGFKKESTDPEPTPTADESDPEQKPEPEPEPEPITSFKQLAESAGIDMKSLYALTIGFGDGSEPMTLGDMKDKITEHLGVDKRETSLLAERTAFDNDVMRTRQEIGEIMQQMQMTPEMAAQGAELLKAKKAEAQSALFSAVPQLATDPDYRKSVHTGVTELGAEYGIAGHEIDNIIDHRAYKLMKDYFELRAQFDKADAIGKKARKGTNIGTKRAQATSGNSAQTEGLIKHAKSTGLVHDQVAAVSSLLGDL